MKKRKFFKRLGVVILAAGVLTACSQKEKETAKEAVTEEKEEQKETNLYENERFQITGIDVQEDGYVAKIQGKAMVYEATVAYYVEDGHEILAEGFTTATSPEWGNFEFEVRIKEERLPVNDVYHIVIYEENMEDGSKRYELAIPINIKKK